MRATSADTRELVSRLLESQQRERRRLASALHDDPIQSVVAISLRLEMLAADAEPAMRDGLEGLRREALGALERMQRLVGELQEPDEASRDLIDRMAQLEDVGRIAA